MEPLRVGKSALLYTGDSLAVLPTLPAESVHCCVTSPPYFGLRLYLPEAAVILRDDLTEEERVFVESELARLGLSAASSRGTPSKG